MAALERWMVPLFAELPHLPKHILETLVTIVPWLALIGGVLGILSVFSAGVLTSLLFPFALLAGPKVGMLLLIAVIVGLVASILDLLAYKPLLAKKKRGWTLLFYGAVLAILGGILSLAIGYGSMFGMVGNLVGLWLLFEVRAMYS